MSRNAQRKPAGRNEFPRVFNIAKVQQYLDPPVRGASATMYVLDNSLPNFEHPG